MGIKYTNSDGICCLKSECPVIVAGSNYRSKWFDEVTGASFPPTVTSQVLGVVLYGA